MESWNSPSVKGSQKFILSHLSWEQEAAGHLTQCPVVWKLLVGRDTTMSLSKLLKQMIILAVKNLFFLYLSETSPRGTCTFCFLSSPCGFLLKREPPFSLQISLSVGKHWCAHSSPPGTQKNGLGGGDLLVWPHQSPFASKEGRKRNLGARSTLKESEFSLCSSGGEKLKVDTGCKFSWLPGCKSGGRWGIYGSPAWFTLLCLVPAGRYVALVRACDDPYFLQGK